MHSENSSRSGLRLRLGIFFILLWWLPIWLLAPAVSAAMGFKNNPSASHKVFLALIIAQTVVGIIGVVLASREVVNLVKSVPRRKVPRALLHVLLKGTTDGLANQNQGQGQP